MMLSTRVSVCFLALLLVFVASTNAARLRADPDSTCQQVYKKSPTREACLAAKGHFGRPCAYCTIGGASSGNHVCYNADKAKWAQWFGEQCEQGPGIGKKAAAAATNNKQYE